MLLVTVTTNRYGSLQTFLVKSIGSELHYDRSYSGSLHNVMTSLPRMRIIMNERVAAALKFENGEGFGLFFHVKEGTELSRQSKITKVSFLLRFGAH